VSPGITVMDPEVLVGGHTVARIAPEVNHIYRFAGFGRPVPLPADAGAGPAVRPVLP
jgi:hypothetical protein